MNITSYQLIIEKTNMLVDVIYGIHINKATILMKVISFISFNTKKLIQLNELY